MLRSLLPLVVVCAMLMAPGAARGEWAGGHASHELITARTLPTSHFGFHLLRSSSLGMTDRIQLSTHLLRDVTGSPNLKLTWSLWQQPGWLAAALELGTGTHTGGVDLEPMPLYDGDGITRPYFQIGGLGTFDLTPYLTLTANLRWAWHARGFAFGDAETSRGNGQLSPGGSLIVPLGRQDVVWFEVQGSIVRHREADGTWPFGFPASGPSYSAALWYGHAFKHLRVMVGAVKPPAELEGLEGWPVLPAIELAYVWVPRLRPMKKTTRREGISMSIDPNTRAELESWLKARSTALVEGNTAFFERILADDFTYTNASGKVFDKTRYLEFFLRSGQMRWQSQDLDGLEFRRYGDVVVLTCRIHDRASYQGEPFEAHFRSTQVLVWRGDGWKYVAGQTTTVES